MTKQPNKLQSDLVAARAAIGEALTTWAVVEDDLCTTFVRALTAETNRPAVLAYFAIRSFEARLSAVNAAISGRYDLPKELHEEWESLSNKIRRKSKARNELAHCSLLSLNHRSDEVKIFPFFSMVEDFTPDPDEGKSSKVEENYKSLKIGDVAQRSESFGKLIKKIRAFNAKLPQRSLLAQPKNDLTINRAEPHPRL